MQFKHVTLEIDGPVAILKLDHQEVMNAVSMDMLGGLGEALDAIDDKRGEVGRLGLTGGARGVARPAWCGGRLASRSARAPTCRAATTRRSARAMPGNRWKSAFIRSC